MKNKTIVSICLILAVLPGLVFAAGTKEQPAGGWKPSKTITLIVPWGAGGSSDLTARILAGEMEKNLGVKIAVVNQPGASGATGTKAAFEAPKDGHTWVGNADMSVATYQVLDLTPDIAHRDWDAYLAILTPCVITVNPNSPMKDWDSLLNAFKTREVAVASAGIGAGGHVAAETFAKFTGTKYKHVPYKGGNPAVVATVSGETEVVMQLSQEVADMLRAGKLRAITVMDNKPLTISGVAPIPPITNYIKDFPSVAFNFGLFIPKGTPPEAKEVITKAFKAAADSKALKDMAAEKASVAVSISGQEADKVMENAASLFGWLLYETDVTKVNPEKLGIPKK
jgi:tripartite-type tricarboxylate transporter receptor subunit TctC